MDALCGTPSVVPDLARPTHYGGGREKRKTQRDAIKISLKDIRTENATTYSSAMHAQGNVR